MRRVRRISIGIKILTRGESRDPVGDLLSAVRRGSATGDYEPKNGVIASISWTNPPGPKKIDEFSNALAESAASSSGFDKLVAKYLLRKQGERNK